MKPHSVLAICHVAFLAGVAAYVGTFYPACQTLAVLLVLAGMAVEFWPRVFQYPLIPEILLGGVMAAAWWLWPHSATTGAVVRAAGLLIAYVWLIPSRKVLDDAVMTAGDIKATPVTGRIKWLLVPVMAELFFGTRNPGSELAAMIVIAIGLLALAIDSWLAGSLPAWFGHAIKSSAPASLFRWAILPVLLVIAVANLMGVWVVDATVSYHAAHRPAQSDEAVDDIDLLGMPGNVTLGDHRSVERDPTIAVRLFWESGPAPTRMVYLRALAVPDLVLSGSTITWTVQSQGKPQLPAASTKPQRWARLDRVASQSEVVLRPDGNSAVELPGIDADDAGNLYSESLQNRAVSYRVGFDEQPPIAHPSPVERERCLKLDPRLDSWPWNHVEDVSWSRMSPEGAAASICKRLQSHCRYEVKDLPPSKGGPGGVLRGFLFGPTTEARRGHCQYFATAAVVLLRRAGHPARCVGGFASSEFDPGGITFRGLHAHAWVEVINSSGEWQRFDPSPESRMEKILAGVTLPPPNPQQPTPAPTDNSKSLILSMEGWSHNAVLILGAMLLGAVAVTGVFRILIARSKAPKSRDPRMIELQRRNDDLIKVATALGIVVTPATTLTDLVAALEKRTSIALDEHLRAHLAARFGEGPLPAPWPLDALAAVGNAISRQ